MSDENGKQDTQRGRVNNTLNHAQSYRVTSWIDTRRDYIRNENLTARQVAKEVAEAVGFHVTMNNVYAACKVLEIKLPHDRRTKGIKTLGRIKEVEQKVQELTELIQRNLSSASDAIDALSIKLRDKESGTGELVNQVNQAIAGIENRHNIRVGDLESAVKGSARNIVDQNTRINQISFHVDNLTKTVAAIESRIADRLKAVDAALQSIERMNKQVNGFSAKIGSIDERLNKVQAALGGIAPICREHENMLQDLQTQMNVQLQRIKLS